METVSVESQTATANITLHPERSESRKTLDFSPTRVWATLPAAYQALPLPIDGLDNTRRSISGTANPYRQFLGSPVSRFVDCGSTIVGPSADSYTVHLRVRSEVDSVGAASSGVTTSVDATGNSSGSIVRCTSTGLIERMVNDQVEALLAGQK